MDSIVSSGLMLNTYSEGIMPMPDLDVNDQDSKKNYAKEVQDDDNAFYHHKDGKSRKVCLYMDDGNKQVAEDIDAYSGEKNKGDDLHSSISQQEMNTIGYV